MKNAFIGICMLWFSYAPAQNISDIFTAKEVTFYGLDFSQARFIGSFAFNQPAKIQDFHIPDWNDMFIKEHNKYNLSKTFKIKHVTYSFGIVEKRNKAFDIFKVIIDEDYSITEAEVKQVIGEYKDQEHNGLGLSFVVEALDYHKNIAVIWITFFDIESGQVLLTERLRGDAIGLSFRNWWAKSYYNVLKSCEMNYSYWKKNYTK